MREVPQVREPSGLGFSETILDGLQKIIYCGEQKNRPGLVGQALIFRDAE